MPHEWKGSEPYPAGPTLSDVAAMTVLSPAGVRVESLPSSIAARPLTYGAAADVPVELGEVYDRALVEKDRNYFNNIEAGKNKNKKKAKAE